MSEPARTDEPRRTFNGIEVPLAGVYDLDPVHTFITFRVRHLVVGRVDGRFTLFQGYFSVTDDAEVLFDDFEATFDPSSAYTICTLPRELAVWATSLFSRSAIGVSPTTSSRQPRLTMGVAFASSSAIDVDSPRRACRTPFERSWGRHRRQSVWSCASSRLADRPL
jgi:hypothetical protein